MRPLLFLLLFSSSVVCAQQPNEDSVLFAQIFSTALGESECYYDLEYLCKGIGHRLAGSSSADRAIAWTYRRLQDEGLDSVYLMPVEVPHWIRGKVEYAAYSHAGLRKELRIAALGGSTGTNGRIRAEVIEVHSIEELEALGREAVQGKIVFFNKAMDPLLINTGAAYGGAYDIRGKGPATAAKYGAAACIIRSLTLAEDNYPHTGATHYEDGGPKVAGAALSSVDSRALSRALKEDPHLLFELELDCQDLPRRTQANVIGEIRGTEFPDHYIIVGGHLDSWDIGEGAHDDGTGVTQSMEVLRILQRIGYRPRHTIRCVLFINEEFGNDGGETYARVCREKGEIHVAAIESDGGGFTPRGFSMQGTDAQFERVQGWLPLLEPYNLHQVRRGWSGVDIAPLKDERVALFGLLVDNQRYFDYHHSDNDRFENVNRRELELGAASMAALVYLLDRTAIPPQ